MVFVGEGGRGKGQVMRFYTYYTQFHKEGVRQVSLNEAILKVVGGENRRNHWERVSSPQILVNILKPMF